MMEEDKFYNSPNISIISTIGGGGSGGQQVFYLNISTSILQRTLEEINKLAN
jgi:hypothetical protein